MLAETQHRFRKALGAADASAVLSLIGGVPDAARRMEIYRRHHRESLVRHLRRRFPTIEFLVGSEPMTRLAQEFIAANAPMAPCMAEYGGEFARFIGTTPEAGRHPYLRAAAEIDWLLGEVAVAVDAPPLPVAALAAFPPERLPELVLRLQPGTRSASNCRSNTFSPPSRSGWSSPAPAAPSPSTGWTPARSPFAAASRLVAPSAPPWTRRWRTTPGSIPAARSPRCSAHAS